MPMKPEAMEPLLTARDVADILRVKLPTIYRWVYQGDLPAIRILAGKRRAVIRFRRVDLEEFLRCLVNLG
jgi:excisionase family DNA binding protein